VYKEPIDLSTYFKDLPLELPTVFFFLKKYDILNYVEKENKMVAE
jgi:hypothetical protein